MLKINVLYKVWLCNKYLSIIYYVICFMICICYNIVHIQTYVYYIYLHVRFLSIMIFKEAFKKAFKFHYEAILLFI